MPAGRFVVPAEPMTEGAEIELPADIAHQVRDVLRLARGDRLTLLDGAGGEWPATLVAVGRSGVRALLGARRAGQAEPRTRVTLYQGMLKAARLEWVLQKGTELGISAFVPLMCERSVAAAEIGGARLSRWHHILAEATEQCGRARVPELAEPRSLPQALGALPTDAAALIPWEGERATGLRVALTGASLAEGIHLFVGPEGGFSAGEVGLARRQGAIPVTLGPRILRAETAALVAAALALEASGELG